MISSFLYVFLWLLAGIVVIVLLTTRFKVHPFFALIIAGFVVGIGVGMPVSEVLTHVKNGFGNILKSLGLVIVLGITLGVILEHTGSTRVMAGFIRKLVNEKRAALAMNLTGFSVGTLIFCDSGFIVLDGLNNSLARKTKVPIATMAVSLAAGLYAIHCMIPPHPGAAAAAEIIGVDFGQLIMAGIIVAIPTSLVGFWWATYAGKKNPVVLADEEEQESDLPDHSVIRAFLPIIVPILLIAIRSFIALDAPDQNWVISVVSNHRRSRHSTCYWRVAGFQYQTRLAKEHGVSSYARRSAKVWGHIGNHWRWSGIRSSAGGDQYWGVCQPGHPARRAGNIVSIPIGVHLEDCPGVFYRGGDHLCIHRSATFAKPRHHYRNGLFALCSFHGSRIHHDLACQRFLLLGHQ